MLDALPHRGQTEPAGFGRLRNLSGIETNPVITDVQADDVIHVRQCQADALGGRVIPALANASRRPQEFASMSPCKGRA